MFDQKNRHKKMHVPVILVFFNVKKQITQLTKLEQTSISVALNLLPQMGQST